VDNTLLTQLNQTSLFTLHMPWAGCFIKGFILTTVEHQVNCINCTLFDLKSANLLLNWHHT